MSPELFHDLVKRLKESNMALVIKQDTNMRRAISVGNEHFYFYTELIINILIFRRTIGYYLAFLCNG